MILILYHFISKRIRNYWHCQLLTEKHIYRIFIFLFRIGIQVKSLVADTLFTCIYEYTIYKYCVKCVSYSTFYLYIRNKNIQILLIRFSVSSWQCQYSYYFPKLVWNLWGAQNLQSTAPSGTKSLKVLHTNVTYALFKKSTNLLLITNGITKTIHWIEYK